MKPIAILQHVSDDGPSYFATWLEQSGLSYRLYRLDEGDAVPGGVAQLSGLAILGGPMSVNDRLPYQAGELELIRHAIAADVPVLGHCLGGQLISVALGGRVGSATHVEIGWSDLCTEQVADADWFGGRDGFVQFQWHGESFTIPDGARRIARGRYCTNQAFVVNERHLAMQFHCEVDEMKVQQWLINGHDELINSLSPAVQRMDDILRDLPHAIAESQRVASDIYAAWARGLVR
jgi:GMP synthase-like glutamine amidotransferase